MTCAARVLPFRSRVALAVAAALFAVAQSRAFAQTDSPFLGNNLTAVDLNGRGSPDVASRAVGPPFGAVA